MIAASGSIAQGVCKLRPLFISPLIRYIFSFTQKVKRRTIQIYDGIRLKMPCTQFDTPCFQLVPQSYTKSGLLVIMRFLGIFNIDVTKICAAIFKGEDLIGQSATNP